MTAAVDDLVSSLSGDYRELCLRVARGEKVTTKRAREILFGAGKTPEDFRADVSRVERRLSEAAEITAADANRPALEARRDEVRAARAALEARVAAFRKEIAEESARVLRLDEEVRLLFLESNPGPARASLQRTAARELRQRLSALDQRRAELARRIEAPGQIPRVIRHHRSGAVLRGRYEHFEGQAAGMESLRPEMLRGEDWEVKQYLQVRERLAAAERDASAARLELAEVEAEQARVLAQMLAPENADLSGVSFTSSGDANGVDDSFPLDDRPIAEESDAFRLEVSRV